MSKFSLEATVGIFVVIGLICVAYMTLTLGKLNFWGGKYYNLKARFTSISGLKTGSDVEMLGIHIGQVKDVTMDQENQTAIVEMNILRDIKIYGDAIASIKTSGLIGDKYIKIDAGGAEDLLKPGRMIVDTEPPIDIEDLISKYVFGSVDSVE
jgi:phospholipid/cholesterol/gamma-HCH transport system substrate-binding protein